MLIVQVARWDERKKWEHRVEALKRKLEEADVAVNKANRAQTTLRDTISRLERERLSLEHKLKAVERPDKQVRRITLACQYINFMGNGTFSLCNVVNADYFKIQLNLVNIHASCFVCRRAQLPTRWGRRTSV
jgi:DNA repair exonuclease SbcCD ATPase subunit